MGIEGKYLNLTRATDDKTSADLILSGEELKAFPLIAGTTQRCPLSHGSQGSAGSPNQGNMHRTEMKGIQTENEYVKLSLLQMT